MKKNKEWDTDFEKYKLNKCIQTVSSVNIKANVRKMINEFQFL